MSDQDKTPKSGDVVLIGCFGGFVAKTNNKSRILMVQRESGHEGVFFTTYNNLFFVGATQTERQVWELLSDSEAYVLADDTVLHDMAEHFLAWQDIQERYTE